jgi:hypothetical protein
VWCSLLARTPPLSDELHHAMYTSLIGRLQPAKEEGAGIGGGGSACLLDRMASSNSSELPPHCDDHSGGVGCG